MKLFIFPLGNYKFRQPPSGGCVLKLHVPLNITSEKKAAAFGRLCVETAACELKNNNDVAAAFGRLCVETTLQVSELYCLLRSRLRAAVC